MTYQSTPEARITTALGPVRIAITDGSHIFAHVEAHINDDKGALVFRGQEYIGGVHLYRDHDWQPKDSGSANFSKRPQWTDAPRTHRDAIVSAIRDAVLAYLAEHPAVLAEAERATGANDVDRLDREIAEAEAKLGDLRDARRVSWERSQTRLRERARIIRRQRGTTMATVDREIILCDCCAIAAANADVSGCEDFSGHAPHALSNPDLGGYVVVSGDESAHYGAMPVLCDGCQQDITYGANVWPGAVLV